jgi:hypothetical protein
MGVAIDSIVSARCIVSGARVNSYAEGDGTIHGERSNWTPQPHPPGHHSGLGDDTGIQHNRP